MNIIQSMYTLSNTIDGITYYFCKDRKWRIKENCKEGLLVTYNRPNNGTTMGNRLVARKFIDNYKVVPIEMMA